MLRSYLIILNKCTNKVFLKEVNDAFRVPTFDSKFGLTDKEVIENMLINLFGTPTVLSIEGISGTSITSGYHMSIDEYYFTFRVILEKEYKSSKGLWFKFSNINNFIYSSDKYIIHNLLQTTLETVNLDSCSKWNHILFMYSSDEVFTLLKDGMYTLPIIHCDSRFGHKYIKNYLSQVHLEGMRIHRLVTQVEWNLSIQNRQHNFRIYSVETEKKIQCAQSAWLPIDYVEALHPAFVDTLNYGYIKLALTNLT